MDIKLPLVNNKAEIPLKHLGNALRKQRINLKRQDCCKLRRGLPTLCHMHTKAALHLAFRGSPPIPRRGTVTGLSVSKSSL